MELIIVVTESLKRHGEGALVVFFDIGTVEVRLRIDLMSRKLYFFVLCFLQRKCDAVHCPFEESRHPMLLKRVWKTAAFR